MKEKQYTLGDFVEVPLSSMIDPQSSSYDRFVGLEHYDSREPVITRYSGKEILTSSVKEFKRGDFLIARRNVYLERAGVAIFDGITSGDSIILRVKEDSDHNTGIPAELVKRILPFVLNSNSFWAYANRHADGMNSKRISKDKILDFEFNLPSIEYLSLLSDKLWAGYELKRSYQDMIKTTDEMVKSQFIEMFGNPIGAEQKYSIKPLGDCCIINPRRPSIDLSDSDKVSFVPMPSVSEEGYLLDVADEEYEKVKKGFTYFEDDDVLFAKITPCMENGKGAIAHSLTNGIGMGSTEFHVLRPIEGVSNPYWLHALTRLPLFRKDASKNMKGTGGQKRVGTDYLQNFKVGLPPIEKQIEFERIYKQADKSKYVVLRNI